MNRDEIFAVVLAGGQSSRLFPFNKVLSDLTGAGHSLIRQAYDRARRLNPKKIHVLTLQNMVSPIQRELKLPKNRFLVDPARRGTWPALMWAMAHLRCENPAAVLAVLTGDHVIENASAFARAARRACTLAAQAPAIVMLGVAPNRDAQGWTGFGVFRVRGEIVTDFAEKPSATHAQRMIRQGRWHWNSGMFFFRIITAEQALARYQPVMYAHYKKLCAAIAAHQMREAQALYAAFPAKIPHPLSPTRLVDNTMDFAIMTPLVQRSPPSRPSPTGREGALRALAVCGGLPQWTDLGQWDALLGILKKDRRQNISLGRVRMDRATRGCILAADRGFHLDVRGLSDTVVAVSKRGLLVLKRKDLPDIKMRVAQIPDRKFLVINGCPDGRVQRKGKKVVVSGAPFIP